MKERGQTSARPDTRSTRYDETRIGLTSTGSPGSPTAEWAIDRRLDEHETLPYLGPSLSRGLAVAPRWKLAIKRTTDIVGAVLSLVVLAPVMLITALAVAVTSPGPVFFRQERVGYNGQRFQFLKFRSMCHDAEARRDEILHMNQHDLGPVFKVKDDPRFTPIGRLIRKLSIDELPQLFHVLSGKMSLVGPRPPIPEEVETYGPRELRRLSVKPGVTCIWQVSGRSEIDFDTWVDMDVEYIEEWSLWLDVKLLARTIPAVLSARGAY